MAKRYFLFLWFFLGLFAGPATWTVAQEGKPNIRVVVDMVQLNVAVTDSKGNYVTGLRPQDFVVAEDGIKEKIATFGEGNEPPRRLLDIVQAEAQTANPPRDPPQGSAAQQPTATFGSLVAGANVFILFDTSNYMYRGFVFAQDAIADFVRSLESADKVAFYSYSRDLYRAAALTSDRSEVVRGVRTSVAGDDAALYNSLLLTVQDAGQHPGRKVIVVFSNGPDNSSMVPPEDVGAVREHYDHLSSRMLAGVLNRQQQRVIECRIVPSHTRAHAANHFRPVGGQSRSPVKVAAVRIESYSVRAFQRANEIGDGILCEDEAPVHVIAGIEQNEDIGAGKGRTERFGRFFQRRA